MSATAKAAMPQVTLGRTGIVTSRLSIGAWGMGEASAPEAKAENDAAIVDILRASFEAGITFLDSAEAYDNEERLGQWLEEAGAPDDLVIGTKFGHGRGFTGDLFRESVERSLKHLRLEKIPLMMVHDPRNDDDMDVVLGKGGAVEALRRCQDEGLVGHIGIATGTYGPLRRAVESDEFDAIQFPRLYTLLNRWAMTSGLIDAAREKGIATLNPSPFGGNILATGTAGNPLYVYRPALPEVVDAVRKMEARCAELGVTLPAAAMAFSLREPKIDLTIVGVTNRAELAADLEALSLPISDEELASIASAGSVDPELLGAPEFVLSWPADRVPPKPF